MMRQKHDHPGIIISRKQFCARAIPIEYGGVTDSCQGDNGGPAFKMADRFEELASSKGWSKAEKERQWFIKGNMRNRREQREPLRGQLIGINSWGLNSAIECGTKTPGVYTRGVILETIYTVFKWLKV